MRIIQFIVIFLFASVLCTNAQVPDKPNPPKLYNDFTQQRFLSPQDEQNIEVELENFYHETSNQICIVVVDDLGGMEASEFSFDLGNKWGVGTKDFKNGIVILLKPFADKGDRDLFIAVGNGLEGAITDLATKSIRENDMMPLLQSGQNYAALQAAINSLEQASKGEYNVQVKRRGKETLLQFVKEHPIFSLIILILIIIILITNNKRGGGYGRRGFMGGPFYGGFGGGSFGGGSSGGGFGGFGGGSFGGGGSGGKW